jgi:cytochrome c oxidase subunit 2
MASSPRTGRFAFQSLVIGAMALVGVVLAILAGIDLIGTGQRVVTALFPPEAVTAQGQQIRDLYTIVFLIGVVIFFLVEGLILWAVLRYRRKPGDIELPAQTHGNAIAEVVWTVVPTLIVAFLFVISWQTLNSVEIVSADPQTRVKAVAGQFQWTFEYLDESGANTVYTQLLPTGETGDDGGLVLPAGRTVQLSLESPDVIHAFYVPQFLFKRDVVPGRINVFEFTINESDAGQTFRGQCAELCGNGHRLMLFDVHAYTPADFDAWLETKIAEASASPSPPPPSGAPSGPAAGPTLAVSALNVAFEQTALQAPADTPFRIDFDNRDPSIPHNVAIHEGGPTGPEIFRGEVFPGPARMVYDVPPLRAGTYGFICTVHPSMTGTLTVN